MIVLIVSVPMMLAEDFALDRARSRYAPYGDGRVHYKSLGSGSTAVVFVHGWNGDASIWNRQADAIDGRVRALFVDLPGFGRSDKPDVSFTMDYMADGVDAVLRAAGVQRAVLVGHSMGTPVIRQYYRRHRAKVAALVIVDGALRPFFRDEEAARPFLAQIESPNYEVNVGRMMDGMLGATAASSIRDDVKRVALATPQRVAISAMRAQLDPAIWGDDPILVPTLAVMAPNRGWNADYVDYVKRLAPQVRYETMAGVGHFLMLERPAEFNALLVDFLRSLRVVR